MCMYIYIYVWVNVTKSLTWFFSRPWQTPNPKHHANHPSVAKTAVHIQATEWENMSGHK